MCEVPHFGSLLRVRARVLGNVPYGSSLTCKLTRESFEYLAVKVNHKLLLSSFKNQSDISGFFFKLVNLSKDKIMILQLSNSRKRQVDKHV